MSDLIDISPDSRVQSRALELAEPTAQDTNLCLSNDARRMDFHQKALLSDEFGVGMAGLLMEDFFGAGSFVDVSVALDDPAAYQDIDLEGATQPDYLLWGDEVPEFLYHGKCNSLHHSTGL